MDSIAKYIKEIKDEKLKVYDFINKARYQSGLLSDLSIWNQICSSQYVLGDTLQAIQGYLDSDYPTSIGLRYLNIYGILQALFIQQDAIKNLGEALTYTIKENSDFKEIREIRNASIGHPTKLGTKNKMSYNYIVQVSMRKENFLLEQFTHSDQEDRFHNINLVDLIEKQLRGILFSFREITHMLSLKDQCHKDRFKEVVMEDYFSKLSYQLEKVGEGIYNPSISNTDFTISMLKSIETAYIDFESDLNRRDELQSRKELQYDLDMYKHALQRIRSYLSNDANNELKETDARIYLYYIQKQNEYFRELAREFDVEYNV
ncbi:hypothetical protein [uncultured Sphaerochaeta sp.]|uniref:hypothetical protein n=1 Tax=uncultured Sphaerochaeta sp. TaxID=886478 RepID=UPI002AA786C8|nr:hypothetical protein [uncultured Sphaerochaeta sp.]